MFEIVHCIELSTDLYNESYIIFYFSYFYIISLYYDSADDPVEYSFHVCNCCCCYPLTFS